ncbi:MAG: glycogen debranching enzyme N-terminal domain-containing protein, partial [Nostoc sp.]
MNVDAIEHGVRVTAFKEAVPLYLLSDLPKGDSCASRGHATPAHEWYYEFDLARERDRGLDDREDHVHAATFDATLQPGELVRDRFSPPTVYAV